jgi:hypothetical protein
MPSAIAMAGIVFSFVVVDYLEAARSSRNMFA